MSRNIIEIPVTERHVEKARRVRNRQHYDAAASCPIAQAVRERFHQKVDVSGDITIYSSRFGSRYFEGAKSINKKIRKFDDTSKMSPFVLRLDTKKGTATVAKTKKPGLPSPSLPPRATAPVRPTSQVTTPYWRGCS